MTASSKPSPLPRRYLAIWFSHLSTDRVERSRARRSPEPRIIVRDIRGALRVCAMNAEAVRLGLRHMMPLADARAMYPALAVETADDIADARLLEAIGDWLSRYTPLVGLTPPDGVMLDITGCAHLFGGEDAMRRDAVRRLHDQGLAARTAIAGTPGAAWALARYGERRNIPDDELKETLRPLPLVALQLSPDTVDAMARVGLARIGDILEKPRAPLAARFGASLLQRLDFALGRADEPITPRLPVPPYIAERNLSEPATHEAFILEIISHLAGDLARRMEERGEGARALQVTLFRVDGAVRRLSVATSRPQRDPAALHRLFRERFSTLAEELDPGCGFDVIRLSVTAAEKAGIPQSNLVDGANGSDDLADLIDRLGVRFGPRRVRQLAFAESHIPEYAVTERAPGSWHEAARPSGNPQQQAAQDACGPTRPLRLFERPEPIDAIAEVPDGPPVRFRWRRVPYEVAHAEGPERIAMEWWRDETGRSLTRDYFRVEDREGRRFWLYREGLFGSETSRPQWYVHGLFA
ncbi:MAG: DNA polymerase Y family protein [Alphaproteobacteria bacterium]|nr:DNA polymerase Y family protein [Alphaproteobacteria bacterium]